MSEQFYDDEIAPALMDLSKKCAERGMTFVARVEWEKGEGGSTINGDMSNAGVAQVMTALAARSDGNIDAMCIGLIKRFNVEQSMFLASYNRVPK